MDASLIEKLTAEPVLIRAAQKDGVLYFRVYRAVSEVQQHAEACNRIPQCPCAPAVVYVLGEVLADHTLKMKWLDTLGKFMTRFGMLGGVEEKPV